MRALRATALVVLALAAGALLVSGGSDADPSTPPSLPGLPPPFLGTTVTGDGGITAALDAYGDVVDLRPSPAGPALIDDPAARQAAGTVPADTGIVPRLRVGGGPALPLWRADSVRQRYLAGTNVVRTVARFGAAQVVETAAASGGMLVVRVEARSAAPGGPATSDDAPVVSTTINVEDGAHCAERGGGAGRGGAASTVVCTAGTRVPAGAGAVIRGAAAADRRWLSRARPLGAGAPAWARTMYSRSLLVIHALTDRRTGAVAAGARDGWAYVWPRDAATAALAYAAAGYRGEARRVARFLSRLDPPGKATPVAAARFAGDGSPVPGRGPQGDAGGWIAVAARAGGLRSPAREPASAWRDLPDYQEGPAGDYLGNAIAASGSNRRAENVIRAKFATPAGLVRSAGELGSGLDSAAAWAVRPFDLPTLRPAAERTLLALARRGGRFGITPGSGWSGGVDPWTAPTAAAAWSLAALWREATTPPSAARGDRGHGPPVGGQAPRADRDRAAALGLLADLRRAATPAGALPERVGAHSGVPSSTTPLAWSHAFTALALRELWPG